MTLAFEQGAIVKDASAFVAMLDQEAFRREFERLCVRERRWGTPEEIRLRPLRVHRLRCTFEIEATTRSGRQRLIGKVYTEDHSSLFHVMRALARSGFGPDAEFSIPQAFAYWAALRVRLEEKVEGPTAKDIFLTQTARERIGAAERCGQWLARFHTVAPRHGAIADLDGAFARCERWIGLMASAGGAIARKTKLLFQQLRAAAPAPGTVTYCAGHGSYISDHVILSGSRTVTIDLDECDVADPSRDLAWFIVSLQRRALKQLASRHALDATADAFLQAYVAAGPRDAAAHLAFHRALECLHRARRDYASEDPLAREWAEFMLDEGLRVVPA
jgi:aminoglycoside phosphotransferase (APT) family kinase protein